MHDSVYVNIRKYSGSANMLIVLQLRGEAGKRQVDNTRIGLQHNFGIGGAVVVTLYGKYDKNNVPQARL